MTFSTNTKGAATMRFRSLVSIAGLSGLAMATPVFAAVPTATDAAAEAAASAVGGGTAYILNTLLFLIGGFLVMWMAAGFAMLEAGLVRAKNTPRSASRISASFDCRPTLDRLQHRHPGFAEGLLALGIGGTATECRAWARRT